MLGGEIAVLHVSQGCWGTVVHKVLSAVHTNLKWCRLAVKYQPGIDCHCTYLAKTCPE